MKTMIAAMVLITFVIGFGVFAFYYLNHSANDLLTQTETIQKSVTKGNWKQAQSDFNILHRSWDRVNSKWTMLLDHQEIDNINITINRAEQFTSTKNLPGSKAELAELTLLLEHIPEKEALNLKNVF